MPPANDNWANFTDISGYQGSTGVLNNVGATAESGEPGGGHGKSVWFRWGYSSGGLEAADVFFSTLNDKGGTATPDPFLRTSVRVYYSTTPATPTLASLVEVPYVLSWPEHYANWNKGSIVSFIPTTSVYYIRVDGVGGAEGNFVLSWGRYTGLTFGGDCDGCPPHYGIGEHCPITTQVTDVSQAGTFLFGPPGTTYPAGSYTVRYCQGYWSAHLNEYFNISSATGGTVVEYNGGANTINFIPNLTANYPTTSQVLNNARCIYASFIHTGGYIAIGFTDNPYDDNINGTRPMTFGLYRRDGVFTAEVHAASWVGGGPTASVTFRVHNATDSIWSGVSVTLAASGGITSPSTATGVSLNAHTFVDVSLTFTPATPGDTQFVATLQFSDAAGSLFDDIVIVLAPVLSWAYFLSSAFLCGGGGQSIQNMFILVTNTGNFPSKALVADIAITGTTAYDPSTCSGADAAVHMSWPNINPGATQNGNVTGAGGTGDYFRPFVAPAVTAGFAFSSIADGPVTYPDKSVTLALPGTAGVSISF